METYTRNLWSSWKKNPRISQTLLYHRSDFFFRNRGQASILAQGLATITIISIRVIRSQLRNGQSPPDLVYRGKRDSSDLRHGSRGKRPAIDSGVPAIRNIWVEHTVGNIDNRRDKKRWEPDWSAHNPMQ